MYFAKADRNAGCSEESHRERVLLAVQLTLITGEKN